MPIIQGRKRIDVRDSNKNIRVGVAFPLNETNFFQGTENVKDQIKTNLLNLLFTYPGERINLPLFGVGLKSLIFEQKLDMGTLKTKISTQINRYMSNIEINNIIANLSKDEHTISLSLTYKYLLDDSLDTIQLNFNY